MIALSNRRCVAAFTWLAFLALTSACSFDSAVDSLAACIQGQSVSCSCADAPLGVSVCGVDGEFGSCQCGAPSSGGTGGIMVPVGGSAGSGTGGDGVVAAGAGSDPVVDAGASAGFGGASGSDDGGIVSTGGIGGSSGAAGLGGMAGDATGGSPVVDDEPPLGEAPYGECRDDGSCDLPMLCVFDVLSGGAERYCASICNGNGGGGLSCPRRPDGSRVFCVNNLCMR